MMMFCFDFFEKYPSVSGRVRKKVKLFLVASLQSWARVYEHFFGVVVNSANVDSCVAVPTMLQ